MSASQFIQMLESKGLLDPESIKELQRMVEQSKVRVTPEALARILVENGQLTRFQATKLITELKEQADPSLGGKSNSANKASSASASVDDLLPPDEPEVEEVVEVIEDPVAEVVEVVEEVESNSKKSGKRRSKSSSSALGANSADAFGDVAPAKPVKVSTQPEKSPWESFGIIGVGFLVLLLFTLFVPLYIWFSKGSAKEAWEIAETNYGNRDYDRAVKAYDLFASSFPSDENASAARVKSALAKVREASEKNADPTVGLKAAQDELPKIANEPGIAPLRVDITDNLLKLAEKFITKADNTSGVADRKNLITQMSQQMDLIRDPRFVGTQERTQNELRIRRIEEDQQRVVRDIQQTEDLNATVENMTASISSKDVVKTYDLRRELVRKYPILEQNNKLRELMLQATDIQRGLVEKSSKAFAPNDEPVNAKLIAPTALLSSRVGNKIDTIGDEIAILRIKGSVVALKVATGEVVWRKFIGRDWISEPKRVSPTFDSDAIPAAARWA